MTEHILNQVTECRFAKNVLPPGSLVETRSGASVAYVFTRVYIGDNHLSVIGDAISPGTNEPFITLSTIVKGDMVYCYVMGRIIIGWLPTWEGDGVLELIQRVLVP